MWALFGSTDSLQDPAMRQVSGVDMQAGRMLWDNVCMEIVLRRQRDLGLLLWRRCDV